MMWVYYSLQKGTNMWYLILGYFLVSAFLAILFWLALIVAKRSDERKTVDFPEEESQEREMNHIAH
jgi:hypothetical protein